MVLEIPLDLDEQSSADEESLDRVTVRHAVQVADRWHLMENASRAYLDAVRKSMRQMRTVIGATTIDPELLTAAERLEYGGYLRREETNAAILISSLAHLYGPAAASGG